MNRDQKIEARVGDGQVKLEIEQLFDCLDVQGQRRVLKHLAFSEIVVECVVKWLTEGEVEWDDANWEHPHFDEEEHSPWSVYTTGNYSILEEVRHKLLTKKDGLINRIVGDLMHQRDKAAWEALQYRRLAWDIANNWSQRPDTSIDWSEMPHRRRLTEEEVQEYVKKKVSYIEKGPTDK